MKLKDLSIQYRSLYTCLSCTEDFKGPSISNAFSISLSSKMETQSVI